MYAVVSSTVVSDTLPKHSLLVQFLHQFLVLHPHFQTSEWIKLEVTNIDHQVIILQLLHRRREKLDKMEVHGRITWDRGQDPYWTHHKCPSDIFRCQWVNLSSCISSCRHFSQSRVGTIHPLRLAYFVWVKQVKSMLMMWHFFSVGLSSSWIQLGKTRRQWWGFHLQTSTMWQPWLWGEMWLTLPKPEIQWHTAWRIFYAVRSYSKWLFFRTAKSYEPWDRLGTSPGRTGFDRLKHEELG